MDERKRHKRAFAFFNTVLGPLVRYRFNYSGDKVNIPDPYLLIANHNTDLDPLLIGAATRGQIYFVATEHINRMGIRSWSAVYGSGIPVFIHLADS